MAEYSLEEIQKNLIQKTPQNFYEIGWAVRDKIARDFIANNPKCSIAEIIEFLEDFECQYVVRLDTLQSDKNSLIGEQLFYTGGVTIEVHNDGLPKPGETGYVSRSMAYCDQIESLIEQGAYGPFDAMVELGAGYGATLFRLRQGQISASRYVAGEITKAGRELCQFIFEHGEGIDIEVRHFDHAAPDLSFLNACESLLIVTSHSIEQVKELPSNYFEVLADAAPRVVGIHLEPFGFQVDVSTERSQNHRDFIVEQSWNMNFHDCLRAAENDCHLAVRHISLEQAALQADNPTSVAMWDNYQDN